MSVFKLDINYKNIAVLTLCAFVLLMLYKVQTIISVFAVSFFIAYLLDPVIDRMEKAKIPRALGILILMVVLIIVIGLFLLAIIPQLYTEMQYLTKALPKAVISLAGTAETFAERLGFDTSIANLKQQLAPKAGEITSRALGAISEIVASATSALSNLISFAVIPILVFYFLKDFDRLNTKVFDLIDKRTEKDYKKYFIEFDKILSSYFRGMFIVAGCLAVLYTTVLLVSGVKPAILIGLIAGILSIVPYLGFIVGFGTSMILAIVQFQDFLHPFMIIAGFSIAQAIESNIITPKVVGGTLGLHPTAVIFALLAGGTLFGIGGMILALPIAAFAKIVIREKLL
ncbi:MAG: AI-2E family transporter [Denitrovibrio sp.]|nr:MAG: AI-2E family transporter [Denitrovibrio sp.]